MEEKGSDEEVFIQRRTWGSPAPPLPDIPGSRVKRLPPTGDIPRIPSDARTNDIVPNKKSGKLSSFLSKFKTCEIGKTVNYN